jgi:phage tail-like protein
MDSKNYPYLNFKFLVEINGIVVGGFSDVTGLQVETEVELLEEGGVNDHVHKLPKKTKYSNLTLKRGLTDSDALWKWHNDVATGKITRNSGAIILQDNEGNQTWRWNFKNAYPVKWIGPELKASSNVVAIETLELAHDGLEKG